MGYFLETTAERLEKYWLEHVFVSLEVNPEADSPGMICGFHKIFRDPDFYHP